MLIYLLLINIISFIFYGIDKFLSINRRYRISEFVLLCFGFIGGIIGSIFGMKIFNHKTKKIKFKIFLFIYSLLWFVIVYLYYGGYLLR